MSQEQVLQLTGERYINLEKKGAKISFVLSQITQADWTEAFRQMRMEVERQGQDEIHRNDYEAASLALFEKKLQRVEGYKAKGGGSLMDFPNWKALIPLPDKSAAATLLHSVGAVRLEDDEIDPAGTSIALEAFWGTKEGEMLKFSGLTHRFNPPDLKQYQRFKRAVSESRVVGGSRTGKTIFAGRHALLAELYDELVIAVSGYSFGAQASEGECADVELIKAQMDAIHKVVAARELLTGDAAAA